jgi:outer membrane protein
MNKLLRILILLTALGGLTAALPAQPAPKILVVDMAKALDSYYKYQDSKAKLTESGQKAQEQLDEQTKKMSALSDEVKDLMEQSKNSVLKAEVRAQAEADAQKKIQEYQQLQAEAQRFANNTRAQLQQRMKNYNDILLDDIKNTSTKIARLKGATLVLDKGGPTLIGTPAVVYADASYDITDEVLAELNKDRPTPAPAAPAATTPAPSTAPAQFTVPNVTAPTEKKP